jgi:hypothetical protein
MLQIEKAYHIPEQAIHNITKYILGRFLKLKNKEPWATKVRRYTRQPGEVAHSCSPSYLAGRLGESQF